jgi:hypothetical protein
MHEYRHIISRMRLGESDRQIAKAGLMGRNKVSKLRITAEKCGWLDLENPLPSDEALTKALPQKTCPPSQHSSLAPFSNEVKDWWQQGISGTVIHRTLQQKYDYMGSYSAVRRHIQTCFMILTPGTFRKCPGQENQCLRNWINPP